jgi:[acyl-carrier-protein] S-malonyltransferase
MVADGAGLFVEVGPGKVLQGLVKRIASEVEAQGYSSLV